MRQTQVTKPTATATMQARLIPSPTVRVSQSTGCPVSRAERIFWAVQMARSRVTAGSMSSTAESIRTPRGRRGTAATISSQKVR